MRLVRNQLTWCIDIWYSVFGLFASLDVSSEFTIHIQDIPIQLNCFHYCITFITPQHRKDKNCRRVSLTTLALSGQPRWLVLSGQNNLRLFCGHFQLDFSNIPPEFELRDDWPRYFWLQCIWQIPDFSLGHRNRY